MQSIASFLAGARRDKTDGEGATKPPLVISHGRTPATGPHFAPTARLIVTPYLRTSGLLGALPDDAARTLLTLLTFLTPNGSIQATATQIAHALYTNEREGTERLNRLAGVFWQGSAIASWIRRESNLSSLSLSPHLITFEEEQTVSPVPEEPYRPAGRDAVVAQTRSLYARPRAEVERMVMEQLGYPASEAEDTPEARVRRSLRAFGIALEQMDDLLARFGVERIEQQIEWIGYRKAKNPRSYLIAAIENNYDPPTELRLNAKRISGQSDKQQPFDQASASETHG